MKEKEMEDNVEEITEKKHSCLNVEPTSITIKLPLNNYHQIIAIKWLISTYRKEFLDPIIWLVLLFLCYVFGAVATGKLFCLWG